MKYGAVIFIVILIIILAYIYYNKVIIPNREKNEFEEVRREIVNSRSRLTLEAYKKWTGITRGDSVPLDYFSCDTDSDIWFSAKSEAAGKRVLINKNDGQGFQSLSLDRTELLLCKVNDVNNYSFLEGTDDNGNKYRRLVVNKTYNNWTIVIDAGIYENYVKLKCVKNVKKTL